MPLLLESASKVGDHPQTERAVAGDRLEATYVGGGLAAVPQGQGVEGHAARLNVLPGEAIVTGGTSDLPVAEEAAVTAELMGNEVERVNDVGVAGIHRLLDHVPALQKARVLVVVAGMEGALPSVVAGLVAVPVIAVPTSVGYGASFGGIAALLAMLNACAAGVSVVNIDNGFGAGYQAAVINRLALNERPD